MWEFCKKPSSKPQPQIVFAYFAQKQRKSAILCPDSGGSIPSKRLPNAQTLHEIPKNLQNLQLNALPIPSPPYFLGLFLFVWAQRSLPTRKLGAPPLLAASSRNQSLIVRGLFLFIPLSLSLISVLCSRCS
jgi:hypothetical protein